MRRENRIKNKFNFSKSIYIISGILLMSIIAFIITFIVYSNKLDNDSYILDSEYLSKYINTDANNKNENTASASTSIGKTVEESKNNNISTENNIKNNSEENNSNISTDGSKKSNLNKSNIKKNPTFCKPIEGEILKEFAKDNLVYSETLKEWTTHLGIDIKAEKATVVKASADGIVKYIKNDPRYGLTIIIEHNNEFQTLYSNLLTTEFVSEGEEVKAGQTIGTVGDSSVYEIVDEPHLHFEILKNNENVNPSNYIKF